MIILNLFQVIRVGRSYVTDGSDVALLKLEKAVNLTEYVHLICLPSTKWVPDGSRCFMHGPQEGVFNHAIETTLEGECDHQEEGSFKICTKQDKSTGNAKVNPLMDMSKLLQSQAPGIPPHIIAQNTLPVGSSMSQVSHAGNSISTHQMAGNSLPKIAPKPTSSLLKPSLVASKASTSASTGITSVSKKSLNNVLDRLSGMKSSTTITPTASATSLTAAKSLLTQQLQAPPVLANPGSHSSPIKKPPAAAVSVANLSQNPMASLGLLGMAGFPGASQGSLVGQPMVQYPWTSNPAQQAALEAQRVLSLAGAGLPGMNQNAAAAAMASGIGVTAAACLSASALLPLCPAA